MLNEILPKVVASAASRTDLDVALFEEEARSIGGAVEKRRREFTTGRACARTALHQLGVPLQAIPTGPHGAPQWPSKIVGSITHCNGYRACAVAHDADLAAIGVDAEPNQPLPAGILTTIALPQEQQMVTRLTAEVPGVNWDRLLFSMKEAVFKAWFPLTGQRLGFQEATIAVDPSMRTFNARFVMGRGLDDFDLACFSGRWMACDGLLFTSITHPTPASSTG